MKTLKEITLEIRLVRNDIKTAEALYEKKKSLLNSELIELKRMRNLALSDTNLDKILLAENVIYVKGLHRLGQGDTRSAVSKAIEIIAQGGSGTVSHDAYTSKHDLFQNYFACKDYASWSCQGSNHPYGYGPRHGSIVFEIGLIRAIRDSQDKLTDEQIEVCIYYLENLSKIKEASIKEAV